MLRHFLQGTLGYVGLAVHQPYVAYHVPYIDDVARAVRLEELRTCVQRLEERPRMEFPDLDHFDEKFSRIGAA